MKLALATILVAVFLLASAEKSPPRELDAVAGGRPEAVAVGDSQSGDQRASSSASGSPPRKALPPPCEVQCLEAKNAALEKLAVKRLKGWRHAERKLVRVKRAAIVRWRPTVFYAYRLASIVYGVPYSQLVSVGGCESHHFAGARNGQYRGVFQEGPMFERGPFGRAGLSVWDPLANVLTAGYTVAREGWRQWECQP